MQINHLVSFGSFDQSQDKQIAKRREKMKYEMTMKVQL